MIEEQVRMIKARLQEPLPGISAQLKMSPEHRRDLFTDLPPQKAGVLLLLYPKEKTLSTIFIKRTTYDGPHSGQVSLPGGKSETFDSSIVETALREAYEEIGINPSNVEILGMLTPLIIPVSNFEVTPVVGYTENSPDFVIDPNEVDYLIELNINRLTDPIIVKRRQALLNNRLVNVPYYQLDNDEIWGATAMIISEFTETLK